MNEIWKQPIFVAIDPESYYDGDKEHPRGAMSLRSMSAVEYVRDDRFDFHLASVISPQLGIKKPHRIVGHEAMVHFFDLLRPLQDDYDLVLVGAICAQTLEDVDLLSEINNQELVSRLTSTTIH